jgi:hypothetical protein
VLERRDAAPIRDARLRAMRKQLAHDLRVRGSAVAEDHGLEQGGPAEVVDVVDVDRRRQQELHRFEVAVMARRDQAGAAVAVGRLEVRARRQRQLHYRCVAVGRSDEEGAVLLLVVGVDVGAAGDQLLNVRNVAALRGGDQLAVQWCLRSCSHR